jgi:hypothetical protein
MGCTYELNTHEPTIRTSFSAGPGQLGCKLAALLPRAPASLPESICQHCSNGEQLLAIMLEQEQSRIGSPEPFSQRGGAGGWKVGAIGNFGRPFQHGAPPHLECALAS